jgi:hypothetical protein
MHTTLSCHSNLFTLKKYDNSYHEYIQEDDDSGGVLLDWSLTGVLNPRWAIEVFFLAYLYILSKSRRWIGLPESLHPSSCQAPGHGRVIARQGLLPREEGAQSTLIA